MINNGCNRRDRHHVAHAHDARRPIRLHDVDGIRLVGTSSLLGQKILVLIPRIDEKEPLTLRARILWTCAVGDGLYENGGNFLEIVEEQNG